MGKSQNAEKSLMLVTNQLGTEKAKEPSQIMNNLAKVVKTEESPQSMKTPPTMEKAKEMTKIMNNSESMEERQQILDNPVSMEEVAWIIDNQASVVNQLSQTLNNLPSVKEPHLIVNLPRMEEEAS